jgi:hypothetical protein
MDDDDLPLVSLAREKQKGKGPMKSRKKSASSKSPKPSRKKSSSPKRNQKKTLRRAILKAYTVAGELIGDVRGIADFVVEHRKEVPAKVGFVLLGSAGFPIFIDKQSQLDSMRAGEYPAQIVYSHPSQEQLDALSRRKRTNAVKQTASRLK